LEYVKSIETLNFRLTCESSKPDENPPNPATPVKMKVFGKSEDGVRFCASKDALALVPLSVGAKGLPAIIRAYELTVPVARGLGYLNPVGPVTPVVPPLTPIVTPPPTYKPNPIDAGEPSKLPDAAKSAAVPDAAEPNKS